MHEKLSRLKFKTFSFLFLFFCYNHFPGILTNIFQLLLSSIKNSTYIFVYHIIIIVNTRVYMAGVLNAQSLNSHIVDRQRKSRKKFKLL